MDLSDPTRAITPTLDGPVLAVLAQAGRPLTVGEVTAQAVRGSEIGIRKCLARLVDQGIVKAVEMGRNRVHELNRDHIAAPVAIALAELKPQLVGRLRAQIARWNPKPTNAWLFGSAARGDGDTDSDVDLLLIRRPRSGEVAPHSNTGRKRSGPAAAFGALFDAWLQWDDINAASALSAQEESAWQGQLDELRDLVNSWTGNRAQIVELSTYEVARLRQNGSDLLVNVQQEGVRLFEAPSLSLTRPSSVAENS